MRFQSISRHSCALALLVTIACGSNAGSQAPKISSTFPLDGATGVTLNAGPSAVFDRAMASLGAAFTLKQGSAAVAGTVSTSDDGTTATFLPAAALAASTAYTATVSGSSASETGVAMGSDRSWTFTTAATAS